jgi:hypothetical protein
VLRRDAGARWRTLGFARVRSDSEVMIYRIVGLAAAQQASFARWEPERVRPTLHAPPRPSTAPDAQARVTERRLEPVHGSEQRGVAPEGRCRTNGPPKLHARNDRSLRTLTVQL